MDKVMDRVIKQLAPYQADLSNDQKLSFYGLFKQAKAGDCNTQQPGRLQVKNRSKWNAWNGNKGMTKAKAMEKYISEGQKILKEKSTAGSILQAAAQSVK